MKRRFLTMRKLRHADVILFTIGNSITSALIIVVIVSDYSTTYLYYRYISIVVQ